MSVPTTKRTTPKLQYVTTAKDIAYKVEAISDRFTAHQWHSIGRYMCEDATLALRNVQLVDAMYLKTEEDLQREIRLLDDALGYYAHLEVMTDLSIRSCKRLNQKIQIKQDAENALSDKPKRYKRKGPSENDVLAIAEKIQEERDLIGGVKRKGPKLLARYLQRKAEHEKEREKGEGNTTEDGQQTLFSVE